MQTKLLSNLIKECVALMRDVGYSEKTISTYMEIWESKVKPFLSQMGTEDYSPQLGETFLLSLPEDVMLCYNRIRRCVTILDTVFKTGKISRYVPKKQEFDFNGEIGFLFREVIAYKERMRTSNSTVDGYKRILGRLHTFLRFNSVMKVEDISDKLLLEFVNSSQINPSHRFTVIRGLCRYLVDNNLKPSYFGSLVKGYRFPVREKLPSVYTTEEIIAIKNAINVNKLGGRRLLAAFLLGSCLGLRRSDIVNLRCEDIDWVHNTITLVQKKTRKRVELLLLHEVGNAIIDYYRNERNNQCKDNHVFLTLSTPYEGMSVDSLNAALQSAIKSSNVNVERRHHGMHSMRHSLATRLLKDENSLPLIGEVLGHMSYNSTKAYLKVDIEGLKKCLLPVPHVPEEFYTQNGGIFYE